MPLNGPSYWIADGFDQVLVQHFTIGRRELLMPVDNLRNSTSGRTHAHILPTHNTCKPWLVCGTCPLLTNKLADCRRRRPDPIGSGDPSATQADRCDRARQRQNRLPLFLWPTPSLAGR